MTSFETYEGRTYDEALEFMTAHSAMAAQITPHASLYRTPAGNINVLFNGGRLITYQRNGHVLIYVPEHCSELARETLNKYTPAAFEWHKGKLRCLFRIEYDAKARSMRKAYVLNDGRTVPCDVFDGMNVGPVYSVAPVTAPVAEAPKQLIRQATFELIADVLHRQYDHWPECTMSIARSLADEFEFTNPRFNRALFLLQVGK